MAVWAVAIVMAALDYATKGLFRTSVLLTLSANYVILVLAEQRFLAFGSPFGKKEKKWTCLIILPTLVCQEEAEAAIVKS